MDEPRAVVLGCWGAVLDGGAASLLSFLGLMVMKLALEMERAIH